MCGLFRSINGGTKSEATLRTLRTRRTHFLWFCSKHGLIPFLFSVESAKAAWSIQQLNIVLGCYSLYLATGHTIYSQSIRADTLNEYLKAASGIIQKLDPVPDRDAMYTADGNKYEGIVSVIREVRRIELVPNRREPYAISMHFHLFQKQKFMPRDCLRAALFDWFTVGINMGCRRSEWAQVKGSGTLCQYQTSPFKRAMAFVLTDVSCFTAKKIELTFKTFLDKPDSITCIRVRFMWQKNLKHNIHRWVYRNQNNPYLCAVSAWINIVRRYVRLVGKNTTLPLAVYRSARQNVRYISADQATLQMRDLAKAVFKIKNKADVNKFSCHSLRVGACCILFQTGHHPDFIQRVLRWESDAWRTYVRDLAVTALQVVQAMNDANAADMPEIISTK